MQILSPLVVHQQQLFGRLRQAHPVPVFLDRFLLICDKWPETHMSLTQPHLVDVGEPSQVGVSADQ